MQRTLLSTAYQLIRSISPNLVQGWKYSITGYQVQRPCIRRLKGTMVQIHLTFLVYVCYLIRLSPTAQLIDHVLC